MNHTLCSYHRSTSSGNTLEYTSELGISPWNTCPHLALWSHMIPSPHWSDKFLNFSNLQTANPKVLWKFAQANDFSCWATSRAWSLPPAAKRIGHLPPILVLSPPPHFLSESQGSLLSCTVGGEKKKKDNVIKTSQSRTKGQKDKSEPNIYRQQPKTFTNILQSSDRNRNNT